MIVGIGLDIVDNKRIKRTIANFGQRFKQRCFSDNEIKLCESRKQEINSFAKRYAAKEACAKALGTGLAKGIFWKDIEIFNNIDGKPEIILHNIALSRLKKLTKSKCKIELSLSDEVDYSIANVIIFKNE